jgi:hypothetical protein
MKTYPTLILLSFLTLGAFNRVDAQRNRGDGGGHNSGENRQSSGFSQRGSAGNGGYVQARPSRDMGASRSNTYNAGNLRNSNYQSPGRGSDNRTAPQRSSITRNDDGRRNNNYGGIQRNQGTNSIERGWYDRNRIYSGSNNYAYNDNRGNRGYYRNNDYEGRCHFMSGPRYRIIPRNSVSIYFGGNPYYFNDGFYYGYYGGYYQPIFPPAGLRIGFLPYGYSSMSIGGYPYYYSNGTYYQQYEDNNYVVVEPPMGATVSSLPQGAKAMVLNGENLYELNGTYYREDRNANGDVVYAVVGKNGAVNNSEDNGTTMQQDANSALQKGDILNELPQGSKKVTIDGNSMFITPDNAYLKEESDEQGTTQYRVVGK